MQTKVKAVRTRDSNHLGQLKEAKYDMERPVLLYSTQNVLTLIGCEAV